MGSLNYAMLIGNVGKDPECRHLSNAKVANFSLATSETFTDGNGQKQERTEWHKIVAWRGLAELAEKFIHKGKQIAVQGKITTRKWEKPDGGTGYSTEIVASNIILLTNRENQNDNDSYSGGYQQEPAAAPAGDAHGGAGSMPAEPQQQNAFKSAPDPEDDLPF